MQANTEYWFKSSMDHLVHGANEQGEVIPRIKIFLRKQGDLNQRAANGETLLSRARAANLVKVINYLESQGAKTDAVTAQVRSVILQIRSIRSLDLNEDTPVAHAASRVLSVALRIFGFR